MQTLERPTLSPDQAAEVAEEIRHLAEIAREEHTEVDVSSVLSVLDRATPQTVWLRTTEAAAMLGVSRNTVKKWARTGYLRGSKQDPDGWWRIPRASVEHVAGVEAALAAAPEVDAPLPWR